MQYQLVYSRGLHIRPTMRAISGTLLLFTITCLLWHIIDGCEPSQMQNGCKLYGNTCNCGYGCKSEYTYKTRRACLNALRERSTNICFRQPCLRGICIQTAQAPGFACKCEGTGYYGLRCEKICPAAQFEQHEKDKRKSCAENAMRYGCAIEESKCICQYHCVNEFMYRSKRACLNVLRKTKGTDVAPSITGAKRNVVSNTTASSAKKEGLQKTDMNVPPKGTVSSGNNLAGVQTVPVHMCISHWRIISRSP